MDKNAFDEKYSRIVGDFESLPPPDDELQIPQLLQEVRTHELNYPGHFTMVIIRLRENVYRSLCDEIPINKLINSLSCIYNFYINPHYQFDRLRTENSKIESVMTTTRKRSVRHYFHYTYL